MKTFPLTQEHIDKAYSYNCPYCPLELALLDARFREPSVVRNRWFHWSSGDGRICGSLAPHAQAFVAAFDSEETVKPGIVTVSDEVLEFMEDA